MTSLPEKSFDPAAKGPLEGVRCLDLSRLVAGNQLTHLLADWGADVLKIERPEKGDDLRNWKVENISNHWKVYARNKSSMTLNLRTDEGRALLLNLVEGAQGLVENFVPGTLERWGLGPDILLKHNPKLVIVRISGWGQTGPWRDRPGFGTLVEAMSGFADLNGFPDRPPALPPMAFADMISGTYGAAAFMTALRHVEVSGGQGQVIDLSLFEPILSFLSSEASQFTLSGKPSTRSGNRSPITAPRNLYRCSDGKWLSLSASMQSMVERLFDAMGQPELKTDPRFVTNTDRVRNADELDALIARYMESHERDEVLETLGKAGVTVGEVCTVSELMEHPYVLARESLVELPDDEMGEVPMHNLTPRFSATPAQFRKPAPDLGADTDRTLHDLGLSADQITKLREGGII